MRQYIVFLIIFFLFPHTAKALDVQNEISQEIDANRVIEVLPEEMSDLIHNIDSINEQSFRLTIERIKAKFSQVFFENIKVVWEPAVQTMLIVIISSLFIAVQPGERHSFPYVLAGGSAIIYLTLFNIHSYFSECVAAIERMYQFSSALLPCLAGASVFVGASVSAGVKYTAAALFMNILLNFCNSFLVPLVSLYLVCLTGNVVFNQGVFGAISNFTKRLCMIALTGSVIIFTAYLSVAGLVSTAGDLLLTRVTKTALSTGLPIVGKIISNTAATLVAGADLLKNGIGVLGIFALILIIIAPFISLGLRYLIFKLVGELSDYVPNNKFSALIKGISSAYGILLAVIGTGFIILFLTLVSFMQLSNV